MFKEKLMARLNKKGVKDLDPMDQKAKLDVVGEMHRQASSKLGEKVAGKKPGFLNKGLQDSDHKLGHAGGKDSLAGHTGSSPDMEAEEERQHKDLDHDGEEGESPEHIAKVLGEDAPDEIMHGDQSAEEVEAEHADHSPEQLDAKIQHLMNLKHKKESGHA